MNDFGIFLKEIRGKRSLREMEKITGLSHTYLSSLEKGIDPRSGKERKPTPEALKKIANTLDVEYSILMEKAGYTDRKEELESLSSIFVDTSNRIEDFSKVYLALSEYSIELTTKIPDINTNSNKKEINEILNINSVRVDSYKEHLISDYKLMEDTKEKLLKAIDEHSQKIEQIMQEIKNK